MRLFYSEEHKEFLEGIIDGRTDPEVTELFNKRFGVNKTVSAIKSFRNRVGVRRSGRKDIYSEEQIDYLRQISLGRTNEEIARLFNDRFGTDRSVNSVKSARGRHGIRKVVVPEKYTEEQIEYLREISPGRTSREITDMFNKRFKQNRTVSGIDSIRTKSGILTGSTGYFEKGQHSHNRLPIGAESVRGDRYVLVKVRDGSLNDNWRPKHHIIWEKEHGPIPEGHVILFGDGDNRNFDIDNLICVSNAQVAQLNKEGLICEHADLTRVAINILALSSKVYERSKELK